MRSHRFRRRPPWWPDNEPWPPANRDDARAWHRARRGLFFRLAVPVIFFLILFTGGITLMLWLVGVALGLVVPASHGNDGGPPVFVASLLVLLGLAVLVRTFRRVALPLGDLVGAAGRVADGDYAVRVDESGPRELRALARAFNSMAERLQMSDQARRNLLADVTHEMRNPLTIIQGNLEGLVDGVYPRDDAHLEPILEETRVLSRLIDDLRTLALAESGALALKKEPTDLGILIRDTAAFFQPQADAKGVTLCTEVQTDATVRVDPARIRQVLDNLIVNALRYTSAGGKVCVGLRDEANAVVVSVRDDGQGIAGDSLDHIFDRFYKSSDSGGTGLGLAIAKNLVAAHGGQIRAESQVAKGTTIEFTLPRR